MSSGCRRIRFYTAGPILLQNGWVVINNQSEQIREAFVTDRHPRTAVGVSEDGRTVFLVVVDGRQEGLSVGMSLPEVA